MERQELISRLKEIVDEEYVLSSAMDLVLYGYDASLEKGKPDVRRASQIHGRGVKSSETRS